MIYWRLFLESIAFALQAMAVNRLRTFLSLLGVTIGIFAIISIFTVIDSLEMKLRTTVASLGENIIFVQKWPWGSGGEYKWWEYLKRPEPSLEECRELEQRCKYAMACVFLIDTRTTVKYKNNSVEGADIVAASHDYYKIKSFELRTGRYFTAAESEAGNNVAVIGEVLATYLFGRENPLGKIIKASQVKLRVIGVFKYEGEDIFNMSPDNNVLVPVNFARTVVNIKQRDDAVIMVKAKEGVSNSFLIDELRALMRSIRKLKPLQEDDFSLNEITILSNVLDELFAIIAVAGWIIGGFSILIGGFGIANIMFVSVKERTSMIGIQKSLGARNSFILVQFLFESVFLCVLGGVVGLILIFAGTILVTEFLDFDISLTVKNILMGIAIAGIIGVISGFVPAYTASRLNPVDAIRSNG